MINSQSKTKLKEHKFTKKKLVPPLATLNMTPYSWIDDRLPEMLWATLFAVTFPREELLKRYEKIVNVAIEVTDTTIPDWRLKPLTITLSGIASLDKHNQSKIIQAIVTDEAAKKSLLPMLLLDNLPAKKEWASVLGLAPKPSEWENLAKAIAGSFFHQSQKATDCRWVKTLFAVKSGFVSFTKNVKRAPKLIIDYPKHSEDQLRLSRPTVRSMEISLDMNFRSTWSKQFWNECYKKTRCITKKISKEEMEKKYPSYEQLEKDKETLQNISQGLSDHFWKTNKDSEKNPKHEVAFGIVMFAADLAATSILLGMGRSSQGRMTLRSLVECLITLKYLYVKDDPGLWLAFQSHGMGQAKLVLQRSEEEKRVPEYLDQKNLGQIANDDVWVEFLTVNIGNWDDSDLRARAIEVGLKDKYDDYYTWPSSYSHGEWGAIRETVFDLCGNPLHRFHRIPLLYSMNLNETRGDILMLLDQIVDILYGIFPKHDKKTENI